MTFDRYEARNSAIAFYDGGWRAEDKEELRDQINFVREDNEAEPITDDELDFMIEVLTELEEADEEAPA